MGLMQWFKPWAALRATVPRGVRVYAIGDIHGRDDLLAELLDKIALDLAEAPARRPIFVFLGDLIDRGPGSCEVVERLRLLDASPAQTFFLAGNHEEALLRILGGDSRFASDWLGFGGRECLESYGVDGRAIAAMNARDAGRAIQNAIPANHTAFLRSFGDTLQVGDYLFVHAGIRPGIPLSRQSQADLRWIRGAFLDDARDHGVVVVHGHTITAGVDDVGNRIGIDTGAYRSGILTALVLERDQRRYIQTGLQDIALSASNAT